LLEGLLDWDPNASFRLTALVCHPHPQFGGTMHNKVVFRAAKGASKIGQPALRFNFRGVGRSQGAFADGIGERDDVRAALDYLATRFPETKTCLMGFSFGARVGLAVGAEDSRVCALVGLGLPGTASDFSYLQNVSKPKLIVQGTEDVHGRRVEVEAIYSSMAQPKRIHWVEGADHFFTGRLQEVEEVIRRFVFDLIR
jgi:alpha/beta superfamily hydrolase